MNLIATESLDAINPTTTVGGQNGAATSTPRQMSPTTTAGPQNGAATSTPRPMHPTSTAGAQNGAATSTAQPMNPSPSRHIMPPSSTAMKMNPTSTPSGPHVPSTTSVVPTANTLPQVGTRTFTFSFKITGMDCQVALKENVATDKDYVNIKNKIINSVNKAFTDSGDLTFKSARLLRFECGSVIPFVEVTKSANATGTIAAELNVVSSQINSGSFAGYNTSSFTSSPVKSTSLPVIYFTLKTGLSNQQFCGNRDLFKAALAKLIVSYDENNSAILYHQPSQVVLAEHKCNDVAASTYKASPLIYISTSTTDANTVDVQLTIRVSKLITQMIDDGTTWRLSAALDRKVSSATLGGSANPKDDSLSELQRVGIGTGVTFAILLIIIIIILIVGRIRQKKHPDVTALTVGNPAYSVELDEVSNLPHSRANNGYESHAGETKIEVGEHDYEYPLAPAAEQVADEPEPVRSQGSYEPLRSSVTIKVQQPTYEPLSAAEEQDYLVIQPNSLSVDELAKRKDDDKEMRREFESLDYKMPNANVYPSQTSEKNRVANIIPRPETRVTLADSPSDYINASYVKDSKQRKRYILAQSPMESTVEDFWKMIYQQNTRVVVMATPLIQFSKEKCFQYWPADSAARDYGEFQVQLKKKELKPDFTITTMSLKYKNETREVVLYRYMTWPENNIPENAKTFIAFLREASIASGTENMMVVHCSDGAGMSAVFVAIENGIESLNEKHNVDVYSLVNALRKDRAGAVQVFNQYKFIYTALHEYVDGEGQSAFANSADATSSF
eukprot:gene9796-10795_t